jgi:hypothetical protein
MSIYLNNERQEYKTGHIEEDISAKRRVDEEGKGG